MSDHVKVLRERFGAPDEFLVWIQDEDRSATTGTSYIRFHGWELARDVQPHGITETVVVAYAGTDGRFITRIEVQQASRPRNDAMWAEIHDTWFDAKEWLRRYCAHAEQSGFGRADAATTVIASVETMLPGIV